MYYQTNISKGSPVVKTKVLMLFICISGAFNMLKDVHWTSTVNTTAEHFFLKNAAERNYFFIVYKFGLIQLLFPTITNM